MSNLARRRTGLANPIGSDDISRGIGWLGIGALVGGGLGALMYTPRGWGALGGASTGVAVTAVGGLVAAAVSKPNRGAGIAAAGIGLGSLVIVGIASSLLRGPQQVA
jgi:hypothetical protein